MKRVRHIVGSAGFNRGFVVRRLVRLGSPRLRELDTKAQHNPVLGVVVRWLSSGSIVVPQGLGAGIRMDLAGIPLSHAHLGSIAFGGLEQSVQEALVRHLAPDGVFYDIGANVGFFTVLAARMSPLGHAYAFEPTPDNANEIRSNAALNGTANLTVIEKAVADKAGTGQLQIVDDQSWSKLMDYGEHHLTTQVMEIELVAVDDLVAAGTVQPPTVVKIDVEGAELAVLEGMRRTIAEHAPVIICELHDTHREFAAFCRDVGYRIVNLEGTFSIEEAGASAHALGLPPGNLGD